MDGPEHLALADALDVIRDLLHEQFRLTGRLPKTIVTVGGTALAAQRIRERSDDVDLYMSEMEDAAVAAVQDKYRRKHGHSFKIDATPVNTLWGDIAVNDIDQSPTIATLDVDGHAVEIRALSAETMYLLKVAAYRTKDIPDLPLIAARCSSQSLLARAKQVFPWYADRSAFPEYAERLARCIARDFNMRLEAVEAVFALPDVVTKRVQEIRAGLEVQFLHRLQSFMTSRPELIKPDPRDPTRLAFDAAAAGAPQELRDIITSHPSETADMAVNVLRSKDPARHAAWAMDVARRRKSAGGQDRKAALVKQVVDTAKAKGFDLPDNVEEKLGIYANEESLEAMAREVRAATSFQALLDAHSIALPSDDHG